MRRARRPTSRRDVVPTLASIVRDATGGRGPATAVLTAGSGAGKSWILDELVSQLTVPVHRVTAAAGALHEPYGVASRLVDVVLPEPVSAAAPELLLNGLDALAATGPRALIVDDVHRADAASLSVLAQIAASAVDLRLGLVLSRQATPERAYLSRILRRPDCLEIELPGMAALDLDALVHEHTGCWAGPRLLDALGGSQPLDALIRLDDLGPRLVIRDDIVELPDDMVVPAAAAGAVAERIAQLEGRAREAARALAVLGTHTGLADLAAVLAVEPVALVEPVQSLVDDDVIAFDDDGRIAFTHDVWRETVYDDIPAPLRAVLHAAAIIRAMPAEQARHLVSAGAPAAELLAVVSRAADPWGHAPAVEADLLAEVAEAVADDVFAAPELAARRARALARSGQFRRAEEVAISALPAVRDPVVFAELRRVVIFARSTRADLSGALEAIDESLALPLPERSRRVLTEHRTYLGILGGTGPVPDDPLAEDPLSLTVTGLVAEVARTYLLGRLPTALEFAWEASRRVGTPDVDPNEGASADVWPPVVELAQHGPEAAGAALREVVALRDERGASWQTASHQMVSGTIALSAGRLADAAATLDNALELAAATELGWTSQAVGSRALVDVLRGDLSAAEERLDAFDVEGRPLQLGVPQPARARVALLEAQRRYAAAAELALVTWRYAQSRRLVTWLVNVAPEFCRVALRAAEPSLLHAVDTGLRDVPRPWAPAAAPALALTAALVADPAGLATSAVAAAAEARDLGERYVELMAREEAAVATAVLGDRRRARSLADDALALAAECGADGVAARIAGRLRSAGVRLGSTAPRRRPTVGWASLTPTEQLVVDQVAAGRTGPEIAQRLNISTRTVQTHVSHVLTKLGLSHRLELAAAAAARSA
jgi:DNA-binding CsgD family transcriptional regulator